MVELSRVFIRTVWLFCSLQVLRLQRMWWKRFVPFMPLVRYSHLAAMMPIVLSTISMFSTLVILLGGTSTPDQVCLTTPP